MAVTSEQVSVADTAVALNTESGSVGGTKLVVTNRGSAAVHLGDSTVTTSDGYELAAGETITVELSHGEQLFAIGDATADDVHVLRTGD